MYGALLLVKCRSCELLIQSMGILCALRLHGYIQRKPQQRWCNRVLCLLVAFVQIFQAPRCLDHVGHNLKHCIPWYQIPFIWFKNLFASSMLPLGIHCNNDIPRWGIWHQSWTDDLLIYLFALVQSCYIGRCTQNINKDGKSRLHACHLHFGEQWQCSLALSIVYILLSTIIAIKATTSWCGNLSNSALASSILPFWAYPEITEVHETRPDTLSNRY